MKTITRKLSYFFLVATTLTLIFSGMSCSNSDKDGAVETDEFDVVMAAAVANNGVIPPDGNIKAADLEPLLNDVDPSNDPLIVDLRTKDAYILGHIPGAINVYYRTLGDVSVINDLSSALAAHVADGGDNLILSYGNTHHAKSFATYLSIQGFPVKTLNHGFAEWTKDTTVAPGRYLRCTSFDALGHGIAPDGCTTNDFPVTTSDSIHADTLSGEGYPSIDCIDGPVTSADLPRITRCTFDAMYGDPAGPDFRITAAEVYDLLDDNQDGCMACAGDDLSNDPFVLSNRGTLWDKPTCTTPGPYDERGHIPGAIAVDWCNGTDRMELKTLENTDFMPGRGKLVVHHCWVGQSQQYGNSWYHLLGYNAITMDWGMNGWTDDDYVRQAVINEAQYTSDFPYETGE